MKQYYKLLFLLAAVLVLGAACPQGAKPDPTTTDTKWGMKNSDGTYGFLIFKKNTMECYKATKTGAAFSIIPNTKVEYPVTKDGSGLHTAKGMADDGSDIAFKTTHSFTNLKKTTITFTDPSKNAKVAWFKHDQEYLTEDTL